MIALGTVEPGGWKPPIITAIATNGRGRGPRELVTRLDAHWEWLSASGELKRRRMPGPARRSRCWPSPRCATALTDNVDELAAQVADGTLDPFQAAEEVLPEARLIYGCTRG